MAAAKKRKAGVKSAAQRQATKLEKMGYEKSDMTLKELQKALKEGERYAREENWEKALPPLMKVWDVMPEDLSVLTLIAHGLARLGVREYAIQVLERALQVNEPTVDILTIMQNLAQEMGMYQVAVKIGMQLIAMEPDSPRHYVNLATSYSGLRAFDESIDMLQQVLPLFPENADLWNVLATQVRARDGADAADVFFEEALRLSPNDYKIISNYARSFSTRNDYEKALEMNLRAIERNPNNPEPRLGAAQLSFLKGDMETGWSNYKYRLSSRRLVSQTQIYTHNLPDWNGEDLEGKGILVCAEQGIGDEVMFGNYLPFLYERAGQLAIGCDRRLVSIYQRRFPNAIVSPYLDQINSGYRYRSFPLVQKPMSEGKVQIDYAVPLASAAEPEWQTPKDIHPHPDGFLTANPELVEKFKTAFEEIGPKPKVGLAWRSGLMDANRARLYAGVTDLAPLLALSDHVDFVNLQYGNVSEELAQIKDITGVTIHDIEGVDLKMDIEANLALMQYCDLVVGACSAPAIFAMSLGRPTMLMAAVSPWYCFGFQERIPFVPDCQFIVNTGDKGWQGVAGEAADWVASRLKLKD